MTYVLQCPACGHDASRHEDISGDGVLVGCYDCACDSTAASLYAAECERLDALLTRWTDVENQRDEALTSLKQANHDCAQWRTLCDTRTAECERLRDERNPLIAAVEARTYERDAARALADRYKAALERITEIVYPSDYAGQIARTALDGGNDANR